MKVITYEDWCEHARQHELSRALRSIQSNHKIENVLEELSHRLIQKLIHPLHEIVEEDYQSQYNSIVSNKLYKENYLDKVQPIADHVEN